MNESLDVSITKYWNGGIVDKVIYEKDAPENLELTQLITQENLSVDIKKEQYITQEIS